MTRSNGPAKDPVGLWTHRCGYASAVISRTGRNADQVTRKRNSVWRPLALVAPPRKASNNGGADDQRGMTPKLHGAFIVATKSRDGIFHAIGDRIAGKVAQLGSGN